MGAICALDTRPPEAGGDENACNYNCPTYLSGLSASHVQLQQTPVLPKGLDDQTGGLDDPELSQKITDDSPMKAPGAVDDVQNVDEIDQNLPERLESTSSIAQASMQGTDDPPGELSDAGSCAGASSGGSQASASDAGTPGKKKAKTKVKKKPKKTEPEEDEGPKAILVFDAEGEQRTCIFRSKPPGFSLRFPAMVVGQTKGPPATEMGIKEGWKLVQWGSKADALTTFSPDVDKGVIRESYVSLIKQLPKEGTAGENAVPSGEETASWIPGRWAYEMDVTIVSASGLRDADWAPGGGSSDPYCVCTLQGRGKSTFKTKVVKNNKSPVWNHSARINDMYDGDQLFFEVFDHDVVGSHDSLGHASVGWEELPAESTTLKIKRSLDDSGHKSARNQAGEATLELKIQVVKRRVEMASASAPEKPQHRLQVNIRSARGLRDADSFFGGGSSDPYCVCSIVGLGKSKYSTRAINDQTDPEWDEKCVLADFHKGDKLLCEIYDKDIGKKDDFLGKCEIPSEKILLHGFDGEVKLVETGMVGKKQVESFLSLAVTARKRDPIGLAPFQSCPKAAPGSVRYEMEVTILSADGLRNADWLGSGSDPYCLCTVRGKGGASFRTPTVQNQHCPVWNHMEKITDFLHGDALYLSVKDSDKLKYDDILGEVSLTTEQIVPGGFEGDLKLRNTGHKAPDKTPAFVTVAIKLLARYPVKPDEPKTEKVKDGKSKEKKAKA